MATSWLSGVRRAAALVIGGAAVPLVFAGVGVLAGIAALLLFSVQAYAARKFDRRDTRMRVADWLVIAGGVIGVAGPLVLFWLHGLPAGMGSGSFWEGVFLIVLNLLLPDAGLGGSGVAGGAVLANLLVAGTLLLVAFIVYTYRIYQDRSYTE